MSSRESVRAEAPGPSARTEFKPDLLLALALGGVFVGLIAGGFYFFRSGAATITGNEPSAQRSLFWTINALSLGGFQHSTTIDTFKPIGQFAFLALTISGSLITLIIGGLAVVRLLTMDHSVRRIVVAALIAQAAALLAGTVATVSPDRPLLASVLLAASAFGNSGLVMGGIDGGVTSLSVHLVLLPLCVLGGLGVPVLIELYDGLVNRRRLSRYSTVALAMTAAVFLLGAILLFAVSEPKSPGKDAATYEAVRERLLGASAQSINARSAGLPIDSPAAWPRAAQWIVIILMFLGAGSAGTGGGLKVTTLFELGRGTRAALSGRSPGRMLGIALVWLMLYVLLIAVTMTLLLCSEGSLPGDRALFIATSAASTTGLSLDPIAITGTGLDTLSIVMILGRVMPWIILWWSALTIRDADVAVG